MSQTQQATGSEPVPTALDGVGDGVIATDELGRITIMNDAAQTLLGWTLAEARGQSLDAVFRLMDPETRRVLPNRVDEVLTDGRVLSRPNHPILLSRDGSSPGAVTDSIAPIHDEAGAITGAILVFRDENLERAHGQALEQSQARIAAILEWSLDAVVTTDDRGRITEFNAAAERMFGYDRSFALGERFVDLLLAEGSRQGFLAAIARDARTGDKRVVGNRTEIAALRSDGTVFPAEISVVRIEAASGTSHTSFLRDLTATRKAQEAVTRSQAQLRALAGRVQAATEEERTRIARELHDELGQQLTAIRMDLGWLIRKQQNNPEIADRLQAISGLVEATFKVVRRLGTELRPGILDDLGLPAAIEWQANEFTKRSGIAVEFESSADLSSLEPRLATSVFRIFQEILTNVGRHSGARHVEARLTVEDGRLVFEVADDGRGIRPEEAANITSLGLLGMRERATLLGGTFRIEAGEAGGTVVTVTLPLEGA